MNFAWALIDEGPLGWRWARLVLPMAVIEQHAIEIHPPNSRPLIAQKVAADISSDRILDRRGWEVDR